MSSAQRILVFAFVILTTPCALGMLSAHDFSDKTVAELLDLLVYCLLNNSDILTRRCLDVLDVQAAWKACVEFRRKRATSAVDTRPEHSARVGAKSASRTVGRSRYGGPCHRIAGRHAL